MSRIEILVFSQSEKVWRLPAENLLQFLQFRRVLRGDVVRLRPTLGRIQFPNVVVDFSELSGQQPWCAVLPGE